jgi:hypothetical protein
VETGFGSINALVGRRGQVQVSVRDRADRLERSRVSAVDATAVRSEAASGRDLISAQVGHRGLVRDLVRGRADRLERSRVSAAGATAVRNEVESGAANGRGLTSVLAGRRELARDLARDRADRLERSRNLLASHAKGQRADLMGRRGSRFTRKVIGPFQSQARGRRSDLTAGETRADAREARRDGCSGPVACEVTKVADRRDAETGLLRDSKRSAGK